MRMLSPLSWPGHGLLEQIAPLLLPAHTCPPGHSGQASLLSHFTAATAGGGQEPRANSNRGAQGWLVPPRRVTWGRSEALALQALP